MKDRFYLACLRDNVGDNVSFHGKSSINGGYHTDVRKAEEYTREEMQREWEGARGFDQPMSADHVDALTVWKVDCQYIPNNTPEVAECDDWLAYRAGRWNGNDVYWLTADGSSLDVNQAQHYNAAQKAENTREGIVFLPFNLVDSVKRPTFEMRHFTPRTMVQGAGLVIPKRIARNRRRKPSSKTRMNCPTCGKIHWQENPYDFDGCNDRFCDSHQRY